METLQRRKLRASEMKLEDLVKDVRERLKLTQVQLAKKLQTTQPTIVRMERGGGQVGDLARRVFLLLELHDQAHGIRRIEGLNIKREGAKVVYLGRG